MIQYKIKENKLARDRVALNVWEIDESKPKISVNGHYYEFNSKIIASFELSKKQADLLFQ